MSQKIKQICCEIIEKCVSEFKEDNNLDKVKKNVLDPCVGYIIKKIYPYILVTCIVFVIMFLMFAAILVILIFNKNNNLKVA